jgi:hypothetical protein
MCDWVHVRHQSVLAHKVGLTVFERSIAIPQWFARFQNGNATHQNQIELAMKEGRKPRRILRGTDSTVSSSNQRAEDAIAAGEPENISNQAA